MSQTTKRVPFLLQAEAFRELQTAAGCANSPQTSAATATMSIVADAMHRISDATLFDNIFLSSHQASGHFFPKKKKAAENTENVSSRFNDS